MKQYPGMESCTQMETLHSVSASTWKYAYSNWPTIERSLHKSGHYMTLILTEQWSQSHNQYNNIKHWQHILRHIEITASTGDT